MMRYLGVSFRRGDFNTQRLPISYLRWTTIIALLVACLVLIRLHIRVQSDLSLSQKNNRNSASFAVDASWNHREQPPLEFVHITKTGGTAVEMAAAKAGIMWGVCHFQTDEGCIPGPDRHDQKKYPLKTRIPVPGFFGEPWHTPPSWFATRPYRKEAALFTIVRNPYDRYISEYYCPHFGINRPGAAMEMMFQSKVVRIRRTGLIADQSQGPPQNETKSNVGPRRRLGQNSLNLRGESPEMLNRWLAARLRGQSTITAHMMPQHLYVYDSFSGEQVIQHVLKYEALQDDFEKLMLRYQLPVVLRKAYLNRGQAQEERMTARDLSAQTIRLINEFAADDFRLFDYEMIESNAVDT